jgi:stage V sporulation protein G
MFNITDVRITKIEGGEKLRGFASITLDDSFTVGDLRILEGDDGYFVAMPSKRKRDGTYKDIAYPTNNEVRKIIEERVLTAYENITGNRAIPNTDRTTINAIHSDVLGVEEFGFTAKANL